MKFKKFALLAILSLAFFLRVYQLDYLPLGVFCDEANIGVSAYSLITTGRDEHGDSFPFFFKGFGEHRLPLPIYLQLPAVYLLGLNTFSIRLPAAILSVVSVFLLYLIGRLWLNEQFGLLAAFFLTISPWHIHLSRNAMEWSYLLPFLLLSVLLFSLSFKKENYFYPATLAAALTVYTYYPAIIVIPLFYLAVFFFFLARKRFRKRALVSLPIFILALLPLLSGVLTGKIAGRIDTVVGHSLYGKFGLFGKALVALLTYIGHFDPTFLFINGARYEEVTRHAIRGIGLLPWYGLIVVPLGLIYLLFFFKSKNKSFVLLIILALLVLFPVGGIFNTNLRPMATRAIVGIVPFSLLIAFGVYSLLLLLKKIRLRTLALIVLAIPLFFVVREFGLFYQKYFYQYNLYANDYWGWQWGAKEIIDYFITVQDEYDEVYLTGAFNQTLIYFQFYDQKGQCKKCLGGGIDHLDSNKKQLFALRVEEFDETEGALKERFKLKKTLYYPSGKKAFYIGQFGQ